MVDRPNARETREAKEGRRRNIEGEGGRTWNIENGAEGRGIEIAVKAVRADARRRAYRFEDLLLVPGHVVKTEPSTFRLNFSDGGGIIAVARSSRI